MLLVLIAVACSIYFAEGALEKPKIFSLTSSSLGSSFGPLTPVAQPVDYHGKKFFHSTILPIFPDSSVELSFPPIDNSIMVWDAALTPQQCNQLISDFENSESEQCSGAVMIDGMCTINPSIKKNTEIFITDEAEGSIRWKNADVLLEKMVNTYLALYQEANIILSTQQNPFRDEGFRMKRYLSIGNEHHSYHSDSGHEVSARPHRILAVLLYLNDVTTGGETVFLNQGVSITPAVGRLAFFPTSFSFVHAGKRPESNSKYVVINFLTT